MKRSGPIRRKTELKRKTWMNRVSKEKALQDRRLSPLRQHYRGLGPCVLCTTEKVEIHEIAARSQSNESVEYPDNWLRLCRKHHAALQHTDKEQQIIVKLHHICDVVNALCGKQTVSVEGIRQKLNQEYLAE